MVNAVPSEPQGLDIAAYPDALVGGSGAAVLAIWTADEPVGDDLYYSIQGRFLSAVGIGTPSQINTFGDGIQSRARAAALQDGTFIALWRGPELWGRRIDGSGPAGAEFRINPNLFEDGDTTLLLGYDSADLRDGSYLVAWQEQDVASGEISIYARSYLYDGTPMLETRRLFRTHRIVSPLDQLPVHPITVTALASGGFFMAWTVNDSVNSDIFVQGFDAEWEPLADPVLVAEDRLVGFHQPQQAIARPDGSVWLLRTMHYTDFDVRLERRAADGTLLEGPFDIHALSLDDQLHGAFAVFPSGRLAVAWTTFGDSPGNDTDASLQGRIFLPASIFADGFEDGTLAAWTVE